VTIAKRPSVWAGRQRYRTDLAVLKTRIFLQTGLDNPNHIDPVQQISFYVKVRTTRIFRAASVLFSLMPILPSPQGMQHRTFDQDEDNPSNDRANQETQDYREPFGPYAWQDDPGEQKAERREHKPVAEIDRIRCVAQGQQPTRQVGSNKWFQ
jgi:hypothetical protein